MFNGRPVGEQQKELCEMTRLMLYITKILFGKTGPYILYYIRCGLYQGLNSFFNRMGVSEEDRPIGRHRL